MNPEAFLLEKLKEERRKESSNTQVEAVGHAVQGVVCGYENLSSNPV